MFHEWNRKAPVGSGEIAGNRRLAVSRRLVQRLHDMHRQQEAIMSNALSTSPGARFRAAVATERPLQIVGAVNANHALLAKNAGYRAIYLSGGGVAAGSLGLPDLGIST